MAAPAVIAGSIPSTLLNADKGDAEGAGRGPGAAGDEAGDRADDADGEIEVAWFEQIEPVIDDRRDRAAHVPDAEERADREQDENGAQSGGNTLDDGDPQIVERNPPPGGQQRREQRGREETDLNRAAARIEPVEPDRQREQNDRTATGISASASDGAADRPLDCSRRSRRRTSPCSSAAICRQSI